MKKVSLVVRQNNSRKNQLVMAYFGLQKIDVKKLDLEPRSFFNDDVYDTIHSMLLSESVQKGDIAVCIEGGFFKAKSGRCYVGDVCGVRDFEGVHFGNGFFYEIPKSVYYFVKSGQSAKTVLEEVNSKFSNITDFVMESHGKRDAGIRNAIINAFDSTCGVIPRETVVVSMQGDNFKLIDKLCKAELKKRLALQKK